MTVTVTGYELNRLASVEAVQAACDAEGRRWGHHEAPRIIALRLNIEPEHRWPVDPDIAISGDVVEIAGVQYEVAPARERLLVEVEGFGPDRKPETLGFDLEPYAGSPGLNPSDAATIGARVFGHHYRSNWGDDEPLPYE